MRPRQTPKLGLDLLVAQGAAPDRAAARDLLLWLAPVTVYGTVLYPSDPSTGLAWVVNVCRTASLLD